MRFLKMGLLWAASLVAPAFGVVEYRPIALFSFSEPEFVPVMLTVPEGTTWMQLRDSIVSNEIFDLDGLPLAGFALYPRLDAVIPDGYLGNLFDPFRMLLMPAGSNEPIEFAQLFAIQEAWGSQIFTLEHAVVGVPGELSDQIDGALRLFIYTE